MANVISIENARLLFRNFSGKEQKFNPAGKRNFCVALNNDISETLRRDGWNIKTLAPRDPQDDPLPYLQVTVSYDYIPPAIYLVTSAGKTKLDEETVGSLDWAEIQNCDLSIRPYEWEVNGKKGIKAYVKSMYVTIVEDDFAKKYQDTPAEHVDDDYLPF